MLSFSIFTVPLIIGYLLDLIFGDPRKLPHPIVAFGNIIGWCERHFNKGGHKKRNGCLIAIILPLSTLFLGGLLAWGSWILHPFAYYGIASVFVFYGLANHSLIQEGGEVIRTLEEQGLDAGRKRLSWMVGRDTSQLSPKKIYTAVLETMAENLSDGVVAPLFFYALGGFPAMMAYKMVNTLDSMIGYKDTRYKDFGCCSAHLDDILNYIPARLTAFLIALSGYRKGIFSFIRKYARQHASPNSGYPEAALAGILDCRFGGPHNYFGEEVWKPYIGDNERPLTTEDMRIAVRINRSVEWIMVIIVVATATCMYVIPSFF